MATSLPFDRHVALVETSGARLLAAGEQAGYGAKVPTCPTWTVRSLVAHQVMVHRWATAQITGDDAAEVPSQTTIADTIEDLAGYFRVGLRGLTDALRAAPAELKAMTFLNDAPPPREFWARRQAHETTIHMVDALAAVEGRVPSAATVALDPADAEDGIDELLRGFFTRGTSRLFDGREYDIAVVPADSDRRWLVHVAERLTVEPGEPEPPPATAVSITGTTAEVYLGLWNRGDLQITGDAALVDRWRATQRIRWS
jgi:uncharacterized protein (TIGR03083 family)